MATANGSAAGATPARRDLQSIPLRGHTVYVWRQPEPTKHAVAWRVVRDADQREVASGEAGPEPEAWNVALAQVPGDALGPDAGGFDSERWNSSRWDRLPDFSVDGLRNLDRLTPGDALRLEDIKHSARGLQSVLRVLMVADMHDQWFNDGEAAQPISGFLAEGLRLAADQLAQRIENEVDCIAESEVRHG